MTWNQQPNALGSKPTYLTLEEIEYVAAVVDDFNILSPIPEVAENYRYYLRRHIRELVAKVMLVSGAVRNDAIEKLREGIRLQYKSAIAYEGIHCGYLAATSISSGQTQISMKTFAMQSGASIMVGRGLQGIITIVFTRATRIHDAKMVVHFRKYVTKRDVIDMRKLLVEIRASDFLVEGKYQIGKLGVELPTYRWHDMLNADPNAEFKYGKGTIALRLQLDKNMMYTHRVTPAQFARAFRYINPNIDAIVAYSSFADATVDIIPTIDDSNEAIVALLLDSIYRSLPDIYVKGIEGIKKCIPYSYDMLDLISNYSDEGQYIRCYIDHNNANINGSLFPPYHMLKRHIESYGYNVVVNRKYHKVVSMDVYPKSRTSVGSGQSAASATTVASGKNATSGPNIASATGSASPASSTTGASATSATTGASATSSTSGTNATTGTSATTGASASTVKDRLIQLLGISSKEYTYMVTEGSNMQELLQKCPWVDPCRTISNNLFEIRDRLGVEASRAYFMYELTTILNESKSYGINWAHIRLVGDLVYIQGKPAGITHAGNITRKQGPLTLASGERGDKAIISAAINRMRESATNTSVANIIGSRVYVGEHAKLLQPTNELIDELRDKKMRNEKITKSIVRQTTGVAQQLQNWNKSITAVVRGEKPLSSIIVPSTTVDDPVVPTNIVTKTSLQPSTSTLIIPNAIIESIVSIRDSVSLTPVQTSVTYNSSSPIVQYKKNSFNIQHSYLALTQKINKIHSVNFIPKAQFTGATLRRNRMLENTTQTMQLIGRNIFGDETPNETLILPNPPRNKISRYEMPEIPLSQVVMIYQQRYKNVL